MVKLVFLCRRKPDLSPNEYRTRLLDGHVPLALRHHPTMRRYTVNVVESITPGAPAFDSIGELWFDSLSDFRERLYDSPEGEQTIARDVSGFLSMAYAYATTEHVQRLPPQGLRLGGRTAGVKFFAAVTRAAGMSHEEFGRHWLERHVPLVLADETVRGYVTSPIDERLSPDAPEYDGFAELYFESIDSLKAHIALSRREGSALKQDIARGVGGAATYLVGEYVER